MGEFETKYLHEVTSMISGFAFKSKHMGVGESRVVKIKNVVEPHVLIDECDVLDETQYPAEKIAKYKLTEGDVLISMTGYLGRVAMMPSIRGTYFLNQRVAKLVPNEARDLAFIKFHLQNDAFKDHCEAFTDSATAQPNISVRSMSQFEIEWPSFENRQAIAEVLSSLDDKINLLKRQNKTLEGMAEALFRQWFIEEAQDGWEEVSIDQVGTFLNGLACQKHRPTTHGSLPVLKIRDLRNGLNEDSDRACANVDPKYIVEAGDLIFSWSGTLEVKIWDGARCVLNQHLFKVTSEDFPRWYLLLWCQHHLAQWRATAEAHATTMGHIKRSDLKAAMVLVPSDYELGKMDEKMEGIMARIDLNNAEINSLVKQRDTLLSKLMSGEVRVQMD